MTTQLTEDPFSSRPDLGPYMLLADDRLKIFAVFDDLTYDRADADILSPAMRRHAVTKLNRFGFKQTSGTVLRHAVADICCHIPKAQVLGASPFDIIRYARKRRQDYYILTPTQAACQLIDNYDFENALKKIVELVQQQPINLYRLSDYMESKQHHQDFRPALAQIKSAQHSAVTSEPLRRRRALG
ncbi:MAG: hypothetical protein AAF362_03270 [Pseudomonadota bacterium]